MGQLETSYIEIDVWMRNIPVKQMHLKVSSVQRHIFWTHLNVVVCNGIAL